MDLVIATAPTPCQTQVFREGPVLRRWRRVDTGYGKRFLVTCTLEPPGKFTILMNWKYPAK